MLLDIPGSTPVPVGPTIMVLFETGKGAEVVTPSLPDEVRLPVPTGTEDVLSKVGNGANELCSPLPDDVGVPVPVAPALDVLL